MANIAGDDDLSAVLEDEPAAMTAAGWPREPGADLTGPPIPGGRADVHHPTPRRDLHARLVAAPGPPSAAALVRAGDAAATAPQRFEVLCKACHGRETRAEGGTSSGWCDVRPPTMPQPAPSWKCISCGATVVLVSPRLIEGVALSRCEKCMGRR